MNCNPSSQSNTSSKSSVLDSISSAYPIDSVEEYLPEEYQATPEVESTESNTLMFTVNTNRKPLQWEMLDQGLSFTSVDAPIHCNIGDSKLSILRIDPTYYKFHLISSKEKGEENKTASQWAKDYKLTALVNAGMYQADHQTNVGYMQNGSHVNNKRLNKDKTIVAFNPIQDKYPLFQIIDLECQNWETLSKQYKTFTQSIRMVDCEGRNKWSKQDKYWSMVAIATDQKGQVLFLFSRSPYSVHDFIDMLLGLPLSIHSMMYLEGGPEASFFLNHPKKNIAYMGSYETNFIESDENKVFWPIPNIIGISPR